MQMKMQTWKPLAALTAALAMGGAVGGAYPAIEATSPGAPLDTRVASPAVSSAAGLDARLGDVREAVLAHFRSDKPQGIVFFVR